ncbi:MAG: hypothetical protein HC781_20615 [Leptolyngbyaceae cyanobacterium CSU_1_4]|nr:hypothetical protein [Leptolyngbyaceae cyanobacterium CSU_1_4]
MKSLEPNVTPHSPNPPIAPQPAAKFNVRSLMQGDLGFIPVILTLALITIYFQITTSGVFLEARNVSNLTQQIVTIAILSVAAVLVLLLGEIDLSLAAVAYACSAIMATVSVYQNWNAGWAILAAIGAGAVIGLINGFFVAVLRVPSFIVTLAGSIGYAGLLLVVQLIVADLTAIRKRHKAGYPIPADSSQFLFRAARAHAHQLQEISTIELGHGLPDPNNGR